MTTSLEGDFISSIGLFGEAGWGSNDKSSQNQISGSNSLRREIKAEDVKPRVVI